MTIMRTALCVAACLFAANASALDLKGLTNTGLKAGKALSLSDQDVSAAADQACAHMDKENQVASGKDAYAQRLAKITQGLANEDGLNLNFKVYRTSDVNAWAMANGCVRVYTGLMDIASDDEIRGVIGHEIGHVKLGHSKAKMRTAVLASAGREGLAASGNGNLAQISQGQLGEMAEGFINAQFSQKEERAADEYGYQFMKRHSYDPAALASMFRKLSSEGGLMSSHPGSEARAARIDAMIKKDKK
jgi:putative metalloprotease